MNNQQRAENAIKWIDKLLTTRMKQGIEELGSSESGYCCLGVACKTLSFEYVPEMGGLTEDHMDEIGLCDVFGTPRNLTGDRKAESLVDLNDSFGYSFNQIAKILIDMPEEYFRPGVAKIIKKHYSEAK